MSEILDRALGILGRLACRVFGLHGRACRGRTDHLADWTLAGPPHAVSYRWTGRGRWVTWL